MRNSGIEVIIESIEVTRNHAMTRVLRVIWARVGHVPGSFVGSFFVAVRPEGLKHEWTQFQVVGLNVEIDTATITAGTRAEHFEVCVRVKDDRRETPWSAVRSSRNSPPSGPMKSVLSREEAAAWLNRDAIQRVGRAETHLRGIQVIAEDLRSRLDRAAGEIRLLTEQRDHALKESVAQRAALETVVAELRNNALIGRRELTVVNERLNAAQREVQAASEREAALKRRLKGMDALDSRDQDLRNETAALEVTRVRVAEREAQIRKAAVTLEKERAAFEDQRIALNMRDEQFQLRLAEHDDLMERVARLAASEQAGQALVVQLTRNVAELEKELARRHGVGSVPQPLAEPERQQAAPSWVVTLIESNEYTARRARAGRRAPADQSAESLLLRLSLAGGRVPESALVGEFGEHEAAVRTRITSVKGILNIDGYEVLTLTPDGMVVLDERLARQQFGVVV